MVRKLGWSLMAALALAACVEDGPIGPEGDPGPAGEDGTDGNNGMDGSDGMNGVPGAPGTDGADGADGLHCWDASADGVCDPGEDINQDTLCDHLDCQGPPGPAGSGGIGGCSRFQGSGSASCSQGHRLTGAFCSCPGNAVVTSHNIGVNAGNFNGSMSCSCSSGTAVVDVFCCF